MEAARFPSTVLRFRNDPLLRQLGLDPAAVADAHLEEAFGCFEARAPLLALRHHGCQFGTRGSGTTPWSRGGDGLLTLMGACAR